eukprot:CAMPEP_0175268064 /NCGR_PEP_ID=MMETSP0093-20121207/44164_1 /TAXON_ID=311494 /ORGANISM="Alexandrium monilatum, Strain CCMP3105" /LENGTH=154 /DNA_ID=CAMNT_0016562705 /DNA_START=38 /DNA_END=504 /DNA_ORIENTATION=-
MLSRAASGGAARHPFSEGRAAAGETCQGPRSTASSLTQRAVRVLPARRPCMPRLEPPPLVVARKGGAHRRPGAAAVAPDLQTHHLRGRVPQDVEDADRRSRLLEVLDPPPRGTAWPLMQVLAPTEAAEAGVAGRLLPLDGLRPPAGVPGAAGGR